MAKMEINISCPHWLTHGWQSVKSLSIFTVMSLSFFSCNTFFWVLIWPLLFNSAYMTAFCEYLNQEKENKVRVNGRKEKRERGREVAMSGCSSVHTWIGTDLMIIDKLHVSDQRDNRAGHIKSRNISIATKFINAVDRMILCLLPSTCVSFPYSQIVRQSKTNGILPVPVFLWSRWDHAINKFQANEIWTKVIFTIYSNVCHLESIASGHPLCPMLKVDFFLN